MKKKIEERFIYGINRLDDDRVVVRRGLVVKSNPHKLSVKWDGKDWPEEFDTIFNDPHDSKAAAVGYAIERAKRAIENREERLAEDKHWLSILERLAAEVAAEEQQ